MDVSDTKKVYVYDLNFGLHQASNNLRDTMNPLCFGVSWSWIDIRCVNVKQTPCRYSVFHVASIYDHLVVRDVTIFGGMSAYTYVIYLIQHPGRATSGEREKPMGPLKTSLSPNFFFSENFCIKL